MKVQKIEISFPCLVNLPDGFERTLDALVGMVCAQYQRENPFRVMWPAGHGSKVSWSKSDAAFLGKEAAPNAKDSGEPDYDDSIYAIDVSEREDLHGSNPHNPDAERLQRKCAGQRRKSYESAKILKTTP